MCIGQKNREKIKSKTTYKAFTNYSSKVTVNNKHILKGAYLSDLSETVETGTESMMDHSNHQTKFRILMIPVKKLEHHYN